MSKRLEDKVAVITGATSGIGRRTAEVFVEEGAFVILAGRTVEKGEAISHRLGDRARFIQTDITREDQIKAMIDSAVSQYGRVDCLFNNAGAGGVSGPIDELALNDVEASMSFLFYSVLLGIKHVTPIMKAQGSGCILNNASIAGLRTGYGPTIYSAAKAAVIHLTRCVAMELASFGVRVNSISPGFTATPIFGDTFATDDGLARMIEYFDQLVPLRRSGRTDDIAYGALYLASDEGGYITGHDLIVDSGLTAGLTVEQSAAFFDPLRQMGESDGGV